MHTLKGKKPIGAESRLNIYSVIRFCSAAETKSGGEFGCLSSSSFPGGKGVSLFCMCATGRKRAPSPTEEERAGRLLQACIGFEFLCTLLGTENSGLKNRFHVVGGKVCP